jgi:Flp pilus assembly protein protease CpaA
MVWALFMLVVMLSVFNEDVLKVSTSLVNVLGTISNAVTIVFVISFIPLVFFQKMPTYEIFFGVCVLLIFSAIAFPFFTYHVEVAKRGNETGPG